MRVFIVDDSSMVRQRLAAMLSENEGIEIIGQAEDAHSAIVAIPYLTPDVVILDIHMPGSASGMYVLDRMKASTRPPVIIMLTNYPYEQYRKRCMAAGASYFFDKSNEFERVCQVLKELAPVPGNTPA